MIKPNRLTKGDKVAIVSLSRGMLGECKFTHILDIAKERLEKRVWFRSCSYAKCFKRNRIFI